MPLAIYRFTPTRLRAGDEDITDIGQVTESLLRNDRGETRKPQAKTLETIAEVRGVTAVEIETY